MSRKKNVNTIQGNFSIDNHILNVVKNVFANVPILYFPTMQSKMFELKILFQLRVQRNI